MRVTGFACGEISRTCPVVCVEGSEARATVTTASGAVSDTTDKFGASRVFVKETGKCTLTVSYEKQAPTLEIVSVGEAVRYRLVLEEANGKYTLRSE